jgi:hypothetical protein
MTARLRDALRLLALLLALLLAGLSAGRAQQAPEPAVSQAARPAATAPAASGTAPPKAGQKPAEPQISDAAMERILERHGPDSAAGFSSKFAKGTTPAMIRLLIGDAMRLAKPKPDANGRSSTLYDHNFSREIGTTIDGRPARQLRVVVGPDGGVVTAYPR